MRQPQELLELYENTFSASKFNNSPTGLYNPVQHIMKIKGKRIRPLMLLMSCDMFGGNVNDALGASFAMEVFHNFTLVHDDIMDNASIRRGVPTVHTIYGTNSAILAGDVMLAYTYKYLTSLPTDKLKPVLEVFNKTAIEIFEGQQMDMDFESRADVTEAEYIKMIEYKTSVLLACCMKVGSILGNATIADAELVYNFGLLLGISFQMKDDYLDAFGESEKVGKRIGGDILQNKKTWLFIRTANRCNEKQQLQLASLINEANEEKKIQGIKTLMKETGAYDDAIATAEDYYKQAIDALNSISIADERKVLLLQMAKKIHERDY